MPAFGFAVEYGSGGTDFVVAVGRDVGDAKEALREAMEGRDVAVIIDYDLASMVADQYRDVAVLSSAEGF